MLPESYAWLRREPGPPLLNEALQLYGVQEEPGDADNPLILSWAKELNVTDCYYHDATAWCGLFMGIVANRAGYALPFAAPREILWAMNWKRFGDPAPVPMLADVLVFARPGGGGHVGLYVGEDAEAYHVLGGNEGDAVSIVRILRWRFVAARRAAGLVAPNIRPIRLSPSGAPASADEG